jgi:hypothetical protein
MNEHTGFELALSDYEKGYLTAFFDHVVLPDWSDCCNARIKTLWSR